MGALAFLRFPVASSLVRIAAVAPVVFVISFLAMNPVSGLLTADEEIVAELAGSPTASVVWLIFDQLPLSLMVDSEGDLIGERFPNFARLADRTTWYSGASMVAASTELAVPAALSGLLVGSQSLPVASDTPVNHCPCYSVDADGAWPGSPMTSQRLQRYVLQAMYVDSLVGRVLDAMDESRLNDDAILVVMSDHGVSLLPGTKNRVLTDSNANDILPVPMFVGSPGQQQGIHVSDPVQTVDLLPTVLDPMGVDWETLGMDGLSLPESREAREPVLIGTEGTAALGVIPEAHLSSLVGWLTELFPDPNNPFSFGPHASLFGRDVQQLVAGQSILEVELVTDTSLPAISGSDEWDLPAHVIGALNGSTGPVDLAVTIDGVVAGLGTTFFKDHWRVSVMIDPTYAESGSTQVEIYEVSGDGLLLISSR